MLFFSDFFCAMTTSKPTKSPSAIEDHSLNYFEGSKHYRVNTFISKLKDIIYIV